MSLAPSDTRTLSGLVLAGGRGSRFGARDKGLIRFAEQPLVSYPLQVLRASCAEILISANRNLQTYADFGHPVLQDEAFANQGPLSGILAGLRHCRHALLLVLPCDTPLLPLDLGQRLRAAHDGGKGSVCVAWDGSRRHPSCALIPKHLHADLLAYLADGQRRLGLWLERQTLIQVHITEGPDAFINLNRPDELERAAQLRDHGHSA